jgi:7-keto-8-aminopelargonate synthetase-like enzyme
MGGVAPVAHIVRLAHQYDGYAYIDDAHGTSIYGDYGSGYVMACLGHQLDERIIIAGSLSKAFGSHGGFIACREAETINFIKTYGTTYAFGGPPSLPGIAACVAAADLHLDGTVAARQEKLQNVIRYFDEVFTNTEIVNRGTTMPIRGILIGNEDLAITCAKSCTIAASRQPWRCIQPLKKGTPFCAALCQPSIRAGKSTTSIKTSENHWLKPQNSCCWPAKSGHLRTMTHMKGIAFPLREPLMVATIIGGGMFALPVAFVHVWF